MNTYLQVVFSNNGPLFERLIVQAIDYITEAFPELEEVDFDHPVEGYNFTSQEFCDFRNKFDELKPKTFEQQVVYDFLHTILHTIPV